MWEGNMAGLSIAKTNFMEILIRCRLTRQSKTIRQHDDVYLPNRILPFHPAFFYDLIGNPLTAIIQDTRFEIQGGNCTVKLYYKLLPAARRTGEVQYHRSQILCVSDKFVLVIPQIYDGLFSSK